jgi:hypothetical protein
MQVKYDIFMAVMMVFFFLGSDVVTLIGGCQSFGETYCLYLKICIYIQD